MNVFTGSQAAPGPEPLKNRPLLIVLPMVLNVLRPEKGKGLPLRACCQSSPTGFSFHPVNGHGRVSSELGGPPFISTHNGNGLAVPALIASHFHFFLTSSPASAQSLTLEMLQLILFNLISDKSATFGEETQIHWTCSTLHAA